MSGPRNLPDTSPVAGHSQEQVKRQGVVTPIGAILKAATGDTTKSPGHGCFFLVGHRVTKVFKTAQGILVSGSRNLPDTLPVAGHSQESQTAAVCGPQRENPYGEGGVGHEVYLLL